MRTKGDSAVHARVVEIGWGGMRADNPLTSALISAARILDGFDRARGQ
jgi:hypothetical protein